MDGLFLTSHRHWWERVNDTVIESHLSMTSGSSRERTRAARFIDRDANDCAISPPPISWYIAMFQHFLGFIEQMYFTTKHVIVMNHATFHA